MGRRKNGVIARLKSLRKHAEKKKSQQPALDLDESFDGDIMSQLQSEVPELSAEQGDLDLEPAVLDDIESQDSDSTFYSFSSGNDSGSSLSSLNMELDDIEIKNEAQLLTFVARMKDNLSQHLKALKNRIHPTRHNKANPAERTKRYRKQKFDTSRKAYRAAGYADIGSYFQNHDSGRSTASSSSIESIASVWVL
ncbi:hypothetical protein M422DRAFT_261165 [Sphaerobolus stellatus SS14]|uniref:Uncharacterized protein n=1 Tax=Sphaerobolus stellatus (strain SS14) TaxID=990650 RepID=A0A0C9V3Y6_SPHS4|nr:hypothetical protein M422DRAFT_261165 [Sphaerobolus stellatus SS14]